jgi:hypothetical protein
MSNRVFASGTFKGVSVNDPFALAAKSQEPVLFDVAQISWPTNLEPKAVALGNYTQGTKITGPLNMQADVLVILYTEYETSALLDVFTGNKEWSAARQRTWCGYGHNFAKFKGSIKGIAGDSALEQGLFGYLSAIKIGSRTVILYKTELHPKQNGSSLPFVPVLAQLIGELDPELVISTGTAGAIGNTIVCGDVTITDTARFHTDVKYPAYPAINTMSNSGTALTNSVAFDTQYVTYATTNLTKHSLPGLSQCYDQLQRLPNYSFVKKNTRSPRIYVTGSSPVPGPQPMAVVSSDYLTVDDSNDSEGLQRLGIMNDTDDTFVFYAISSLVNKKPKWLSIRNASEPQILCPPFPPGTSQQTIVDKLKGIAGNIYGIYQYCTTLNSALACWGVVAGL